MDVTRIFSLAANLVAATEAGDHERALLLARDLRAAADGLAMRLVQQSLTPMARAKSDLSRILAANGGVK